MDQFAYQVQFPHVEQLPNQHEQRRVAVELEWPPHSHSKPEAKTAPSRESVFFEFAQCEQPEQLKFLQSPTELDLIAISVRKSLRFLRDSCEEVQPQINSILVLREKLLNVCQLLIAEGGPEAWSLIRDIILGFESETLSKLVLNERRSNGVQGPGFSWSHNREDEQSNPMGLEPLLNRIRNILTGWYKHNDTTLDPDEAGSRCGPAGGQQPNIRSYPQKRHIPEDEPPLIKYRREDSLLNHEEYLALLRNLCHDKSAVRATTRPDPPPLQLLDRHAAPTWPSILSGNWTLPFHQPPLPSRPVYNHVNREYADYARLLERDQRKVTPPPPPLMSLYGPRSMSSHASPISSSESIFRFSSAEDSVQTIDDSSDGQVVPATCPSHSNTVTQHEIMQRRFANSVFFKDNFEEAFNEKIEHQRQEINHRRNLAQSEVDKSRDTRWAFEKRLRENIFPFHLSHKPLLIIGPLDKKESEFIPLTEKHMKRYNKLIQGEPQQVLVFKFSLKIYRSDIRTLIGRSWLNDEVINFYMCLLTERSELRAGKVPSVYAMNTFFVPRLLQSGYEGVKRWTRKVDLFSKDIIPVPVHCNGEHWCMAIIHMRNKTIKYYDSMGKPNQNVLDALESYLLHESLDKRQLPFDTSGFKIESEPNIPQQTNGNDCGVFTCMYAEYISRDAPITFTQEHMEYFRKKMVLEIAAGQLWL